MNYKFKVPSSKFSQSLASALVELNLRIHVSNNVLETAVSDYLPYFVKLCWSAGQKIVMEIQRKVTRLNKVKTRLTWSVDKNIVGQAKEGEKTFSPSYKVKLLGEESVWALGLYPKGDHAGKGKSVSLHMFYPDAAEKEKASQIKVSFSLAVMKDEKLYHEKYLSLIHI